MDAVAPARKRRRWHLAAWLGGALIALAVAGVVLMFVFWPFRYRKVHPLLEQEFQSRVVVKHYYRTYFPHPGFVADGVTFWRNGHEGEPPLANVDHLHVVGTWTGLLFTPHTLYQIWLRGVQVRIVLPGGDNARNQSAMASGGQPNAGADESPAASSSPAAKKQSQSKLRVETIVANGATLDLLRRGKPPLHFILQTLQIHNVHAGEPLTFFTRMRLPHLRAVVAANGSLGPFQTGKYGEMAVRGGFSITNVQLRRVSTLDGSVSASGGYSGRLDQIAVQGKLAIPDFRASGRAVRLDAAYNATVKSMLGEVDIPSAEVRMAGSTLTANATIAGNPKITRVNFATADGDLHRLLEVVEKVTPSVAGKVSFRAQAEFGSGPQPFLRRLRLQGHIAVTDVTFVKAASQKAMDAFSARASKQKTRDVVKVTAAASAHTTFRNGMAYLRDVQVTLPGARAQLGGTFNLTDTRVNLTGKVATQQELSKDVTGWKRLLVAPLSPFFKHGKAGAVVSIAVTGTARNPKIGQNLFHTK
jgi:hypothetical protein